MQQQPSKKSFATQLAEANNTVQAKGLVLSRWDKSLVKADKSKFKSLTVKDGFWFTLGKLLAEILEESGGNRMDSALLKDANLHTVAKQRRQEALKFFQNFDFIVENDLLGKFASMKALLSEVAKLQKPKAEVTEGEDEQLPFPVPQEWVDEARSDSGPSTEGETQSKTAEDIAFEAMLQCDANGISFKDLLLALKEQQSLLNSEAA
jgi:hypothetical protein|tara:strand:+ start:306 stop:926 length:621 start_codon:yes stop_codon:yes gene_type:complete